MKYLPLSPSVLSLLLLLPLLLAGCSLFSSDPKEKEKKTYSENRARMEEEAQQRLGRARVFLASGCLNEAKAEVEKMRSDCYLAISARNEGILLMDSIDIRLAQTELAHIDSLLRLGVDSVNENHFNEACGKIQFYERKLQHDLKQQ